MDPAGPDPSTHFADVEANTKVNYPWDTYRSVFDKPSDSFVTAVA
ncbi:hypothetical protein [Streptomyces sp. NPDC010273]